MYTETQPNFVLQDNPKKAPNRSGSSVVAEWWQIWTILTLILSIASIFLVFNQIQPEVYRNEFLIIDQAKSSVYLIHQSGPHRKFEEFNFIVAPTIDKLCAEDFQSELKESNLEAKINPIRQLESDLHSLEEETEGKLRVLTKESQISDLFSAANNSLVEERLFFEKKHLLAEDASKILSSLHQTCRQPEQAFTYLDSISDSLSSLSNLEGIDREKLASLTETVETWKAKDSSVNLATVFTEDKAAEQFLEDLENLDLFSQKVTQSQIHLQNEFIKLEKWQVAFTQENAELRQKLVLIEDFEDDSTK